MEGKVLLQRTLFSGLIAIALIVFGSFVAIPTRASAASTPTTRISLLVKTPEGTVRIPVDGKPHLIKQLKHACLQDPSGCVLQQFIKAQFASQPSAQASNALAVARPSYACPTNLNTWNYTDDYSGLFGIHYWHIELDTTEKINPCTNTLTHSLLVPRAQGIMEFGVTAQARTIPPGTQQLASRLPGTNKTHASIPDLAPSVIVPASRPTWRQMVGLSAMTRLEMIPGRVVLYDIISITAFSDQAGGTL